MKILSRVKPRLAAISLSATLAITILGAGSPTVASEAGITIAEVRYRIGQTAEIHSVSRTPTGLEISGVARSMGLSGVPIDVDVTVDGVDAPRLATSRVVPRTNPEGRFAIAVNATPGTHAVCMVGFYRTPLECVTITAGNEVGQLREVTWAYVDSETNEFRTYSGTDTSRFYRPGEVPSLRVHGTLFDAQGNPRGEDIRITVNGVTVPHQSDGYDPEPGQTQSDAFAATVRAANTVDNEVCVYTPTTNNLIGCKRLVSTPETNPLA